MGKTRVHLLAKELGIETKDLIAHLDRLGMRGRKAQSALEDDEVTRIRTALAVQEKPQVHVGEEKVVADRVVKSEDESLGEVQARETIVERRVRTNVIRRRTSRVEVPQPEKPPVEVEAVRPPVEAPAEIPIGEPLTEAAPAEVAPEIRPAAEESLPEVPPPAGEPTQVEAIAAELSPVAPLAETEAAGGAYSRTHRSAAHGQS
jgi:hypothetical protein